MGLGILFVGYFLLLNFAYHYFTDAIAAAVMMYAFYKLSYINTGFKRAMYASAGFAVLGILEFAVTVINSFMPIGGISYILTASAIVRHMLIFTLTFFMLTGLRDLAEEVDISTLVVRCKRNIYFAVPIYSLSILLEAGELADLISPKIIVTLYFVSLVLTVAIIILNLMVIYGAHMRIYVPEDEKKKKKKSRLAEAFEAHEEEKAREYAEYRLEKLKLKNNKKEKKK